MDAKIIVALDYSDVSSVKKILSKLSPELCKLKVGKELFTAAGPAIVEMLVEQGYSVFLDLKYHDIPNTVAKSCAVAKELGVWMLNVHALGGQRMMQAAREALGDASDRPSLIAVTILTSMDNADVAGIGLSGSAAKNAVNLAKLAIDSNLDGVVCSAQESSEMRQVLGDRVLLVTPGIRLTQETTDDQRRIMTPVDAMNAGSSYLVMGRPITGSDDPAKVLLDLNQQLP
ncbi:MAG: orotidine-5'-phosphate decarboxylase [Gammaproteobacteria bacterium]|nr:orotidine-5'-phosphate decarboxylase [Gammaproteobacteria bacterium]